jgi:imidazolonepropionase-like amidohydrolase
MSERLVLTADRLIDAAGHALEHAALVIEEGRIAACGRQADLEPLLDGAQRRDFGDATLLPGLVDAHVHVTFPADGRPYGEMMEEHDEYLALLSLDNISAHAASGVTTLRDNGARNHSTFAIKRFLERHRPDAPRLLVAGRPVTMTAGHLHWCNEVADGVDSVRRAVRRLAAEGADHIKLVGSGGGTQGTQPYFTSYGTNELRAAVETAHEHGLLTTVHCHARDGIQRAIDAGVDCIEHASFLIPPAHGRPRRIGVAWTGIEADYDPRLVEALARSGAYVGATLLGGYEAVLRGRERAATGEPLQPAEGERIAVAEEHVARKRDVFAALARDGLLGRLVVSTDAGPGDTRFGRLNLALEVAVEGGVTPTQAIEAATRVAAESCGIAATVGTLEPGKEADVLAVAGDAAADIHALRRPLAVYRAGRALHVLR